MQHAKKVIILLAAVVILFLVFVVTRRSSNSIEEAIPETTTAPAMADPYASAEPLSNGLWVPQEFDEVGLKFSAPPEMQVRGELLDDSTFTLYVERSAFPEADYYQLYGLYQIDPNYDPETADIEGVTDGLEPDSIKRWKISGYTAVSGQNKGERNRLVTMIFTDKGLFTLSTSQPTAENGVQTEAILETFEIE